MNVKMMAILATEIFKTVNNLNPFFMKIFLSPNFIPKFDQIILLLKGIIELNMVQKVFFRSANMEYPNGKH